MAGIRPLVVIVDADDLERLQIIAHSRGTTTPGEVASQALHAWLAGPGQHELAAAADRLAGPRDRGGE